MSVDLEFNDTIEGLSPWTWLLSFEKGDTDPLLFSVGGADGRVFMANLHSKAKGKAAVYAFAEMDWHEHEAFIHSQLSVMDVFSRAFELPDRQVALVNPCIFKPGVGLVKKGQFLPISDKVRFFKAHFLRGYGEYFYEAGIDEYDREVLEVYYKNYVTRPQLPHIN